MAWDDQEYFTTGEAAKILGTSLFTVMRYFDRGILWGIKHPVTNWRKIHRDSIKQLAEKAGIILPVQSFLRNVDQENETVNRKREKDE